MSLKHDNFVKRNEKRERTRRNRNSRQSLVETAVMGFWTVVGISLISIVYLALPARYHFPDQWEEAAKYVMFSSVFLIASGSEWRRKKGFWILWAISSTAHLVIVHGWIVRFGTLVGRGRRSDEWAILLGPVLFLVVCGFGFFLTQCEIKKARLSPRP